MCAYLKEMISERGIYQRLGSSEQPTIAATLTPMTLASRFGMKFFQKSVQVSAESLIPKMTAAMSARIRILATMM